jgi:putative oxidoreductase
MSAISQASVNPTAFTASRDQAGRLRPSTELLGRVLLSLMFLMSGLSKISGYAATAGYMASVGVPGALLPLVILTEVGGAVAVIVGWNTRIAAILLAGFTLLAGLLFHNNFADQIQMIMFMKNLSITGAFLMLAANGPGRYSLDARRAK